MNRDPDLVKFGETVRRLRQSRKLSQEALAELSDLHRNYIGGIERGERNVGIKAVYSLARALKVPPDALFIEH
ncbi:helix-turn-helix transcriptional regulator (plasmid) [Brevundimonas sp. BH3]|uniref:helix-turn-helix domain-containing protein n=1 Tax=Brevundimonas sp. BH3 TaxID=3133089 RepID=UPI0031588337